jgi:inosose dehydratase
LRSDTCIALDAGIRPGELGGLRNTFIAGRDPVAFAERFRGRISHVRVNDATDTLAATARADLPGIAVRHCAFSDGVNAANVHRCREFLVENGCGRVLDIECPGQGGPSIQRSLAWLRSAVKERTDTVCAR